MKFSGKSLSQIKVVTTEQLVISIGTFPYDLCAVAIPWSLDQDKWVLLKRMPCYNDEGKTKSS